MKYILTQIKLISFCIDLIEDTNKDLKELSNKFLDVVMVSFLKIDLVMFLSNKMMI